MESYVTTDYFHQNIILIQQLISEIITIYVFASAVINLQIYLVTSDVNDPDERNCSHLFNTFTSTIGNLRR